MDTVRQRLLQLAEHVQCTRKSGKGNSESIHKSYMQHRAGLLSWLHLRKPGVFTWFRVQPLSGQVCAGLHAPVTLVRCVIQRTHALRLLARLQHMFGCTASSMSAHTVPCRVLAVRVQLRTTPTYAQRAADAVRSIVLF